MEIDKILSVSTAHITEQDAELLENETGFTVGKYEEGVFLFINMLTKRKRDFYSETFYDLILLAQALKCRFINLDRDADRIPGLPTFDW